MRWAGHVARIGEGRNVCRVLIGKHKGKYSLERPRRKWERGIRIDLRNTGLAVWSGFSWLRVGIFGGSCECNDDPYGSGATDLVS
jgi:hypothetical protein